MQPQSERELAEIVRDAQGPLRVVGGGTRGFSGDGETVSTGGLAGITLYEPGALTLVAGAGTPVAEVEAALAAEGQRLAFEPMDHRVLLGTEGEPTLGGCVAANVSGPRRVAVGACRDFLLGVRFVDGAGTIVKNGGRVMKNVTGYDLVKLMAGSFGSLGVLSEVSLKVLPKPRAEATLAVEGLDPEAAVAAMSAALGSPFEVTGAAWDRGRGRGRALIRIEGFEDSVTYRAGRLTEVLAAFGAVTPMAQEESAACWTDVRDVAAFRAKPLVWRVSTRPSSANKVIAGLTPGVQVRMDWGGGLIWVAADAGADQLHQDLQARVARIGGHATLVKGELGTRGVSRFQPEPAPVAALSAGLRAKFDPRGILNPGVMDG